MIELVPGEAALLVIDPQNAFCHPDGTFGRSGIDVAPLAAVVPRVVELMGACQARGIPVICTLRRDWHEAALAVWDHYLGEVVALDEVVGQLAADRAAT